MRRASRCAAFLSALLAIAHAPAAAQELVCTASPADAKLVRETVHAFYQAETARDSARWRAMTTSDFYMFHEGVNMPPSEFAAWIDRQREMFKRDKAARWTIDVLDLKVSVDCTTAFATQILHNVAEFPSRGARGKYDEHFQESLWLRKSPDKG